MECQPTCSSLFGGIAYPQSAQGNVKSKTFRICAARAGHADPCTGDHHSLDSCNLHWFHFF
jgi:hypothetical protein